MTSNEIVNQQNKLLKQSNYSNFSQKASHIQQLSLANQQNTLQQLSQGFTFDNQKIKSRQSSKKRNTSKLSDTNQHGNNKKIKYYMNNGKVQEKKFYQGKSIDEHEEENKENILKLQIDSLSNINEQLQSVQNISEKYHNFKYLIQQIHCKKQVFQDEKKI